MEVLRPRLSVPADIAVPGGTLPGGGAKEQTSQRTPPRIAHQVLEVFPNAAAVALASNQLVSSLNPALDPLNQPSG